MRSVAGTLAPVDAQLGERHACAAAQTLWVMIGLRTRGDVCPCVTVR
jgi:hypothetical protein